MFHLKVTNVSVKELTSVSLFRQSTPIYGIKEAGINVRMNGKRLENEWTDSTPPCLDEGLVTWGNGEIIWKFGKRLQSLCFTLRNMSWIKQVDRKGER